MSDGRLRGADVVEAESVDVAVDVGVYADTGSLTT